MATGVPAELETYKSAQDIARAVLADITRYIVPDASESLLLCCSDSAPLG